MLAIMLFGTQIATRELVVVAVVVIALVALVAWFLMRRRGR